MANMANLLTMLDSIFLFSHDTGYIFVKIIQDSFEKIDVQFRVQIKKSEIRRRRKWPDFLMMMLFTDPKN